MHRALVHLELSPIAAQEFVMNCITSMGDLRTLDAEDNCLIKQIPHNGMNGLSFPYKAQQCIYAIRYLTNHQYILGHNYNATSITWQLAVDWIQCMKDEKEVEDVTKTTADLIKAPEAFKKKHQVVSLERKCADIFECTARASANTVDLYHHENDEPALDVEFTTVHEELVHRTILFGKEFNAYNGKVYDFLQSLTLNGPAWPWINAHQRARNGRGA